MDGSPVRLAVFDDVVRKNAQVRFFYRLYEKSPILLKTALLIIYGFKCYLSVNWGRGGDVDLAFFASFPNEHVSLEHVRRHLHGPTSSELTVSTRNCLSAASFRAIPAFLLAALRLQRVTRKLARRHHFLPACRVISSVTYYARFRRLLRQHDVKAVFIASHYAPECLALAAAAHQSGKKVLFTNHASATWQTGYAPTLHCDLAVLTSRAVLDTYLPNNNGKTPAVFIPLAAPQTPMRGGASSKDQFDVGIFLTALTNMARLQDLVAQLAADPKVGRILIRPHPAKIINEDLSELCLEGARIEDTGGTPLFDNAKRCDIAICGNSTVTIELLRCGAPVLYDAGLDHLIYDYNGYVKHGLVLPMPATLDSATLQSLDRFYGSASWLSTMRYFDCGYRQDESAMFQEVGYAIREAVMQRRPATATGRGPSRRGLEDALQGSEA